MYQEERLYHILNLLKEKGSLSNQEIMTQFQISRDTARRDIVRLTQEGSALRTHGGITLPTYRREIRTYKERITMNQDIKKKLAQRAADYLSENQVYFFDVSTTICELCGLIPDSVTVFTNSLENIDRFPITNKNINMIGGHYNIESRMFAGSAALLQLEDLHFDCAFLGAASISENGIYFVKQDDAAIKSTAVRHSSKVIVLADDSKFYTQTMYRGCGFDQIDTLITNRIPPVHITDSMKKHGTQLVLAE